MSFESGAMAVWKDGIVIIETADTELFMTPEIMDTANTCPEIGGLGRDGDIVTFGTHGKGLGRLAYRIIGQGGDGIYWLRSLDLEALDEWE